MLDKVFRFLRQCCLPDYCILCGEPVSAGTDLCQACTADLPLLLRTREPKPAPLLDGVIAPFFYRDEVRQAIRRLKWQQDRHTGEGLTAWMAENVRHLKLSPGQTVVIPVPMTLGRHMVRGYNQTAVLGRNLARRLGVRYADDLLRKVRSTKKQHTLSAAERRENLKDCFRLADPADLSGMTVLLVDDVFTTGSTMAACSQVLRTGGARKVYGLAVAIAGEESHENKERSGPDGISGRGD